MTPTNPTNPTNATEVVKVWETTFPNATSAGLSPDGSRIWCADVEGGRVLVIDATDGKVLTTINSSARNAVFSSNSDRLVLVDNHQQVLVVANPNGAIITTVPFSDSIKSSVVRDVGAYDVQLSDDRKLIYVPLSTGQLLRVDIEGNAVETIFDWHDYRDQFEFVNNREEISAMFNVDIVTSRKVVGRVENRLFVYDLREEERKQLRVIDGRFAANVVWVDRNNEELFLSTWDEGCQLPCRIVVFDLNRETLRRVCDRVSLPATPNSFVNQARNRVVQVPATIIGQRSTLVVSNLQSGDVIQSEPCRTGVRSDGLSADAEKKSWIILDKDGNISMWKWKAPKK